jgi:ATP phosphoribosyltransferase
VLAVIKQRSTETLTKDNPMEHSEQRIKIAVQKTGRLTDHSIDLLERCGLKVTKSKNQLICYGENMPIDLLLVRDDDIPGLVSDDVCDLGIVGLNVVEEKRLKLEQDGSKGLFKQIFELDFGHCRLSIAVPEGVDFSGPESLENSKIATSYVGLLTDYLKKNRIKAEPVFFSGAVEIAPKLGRADYICDLVSSGETLVANGLREVAVLLESEAVVIQTLAPLGDEKQALVDKLIQRLDGVLKVRDSKYIMLHAPRSALAEIRSLLPGSEAPTVLPLEGSDDRVAIHAVCRENVFWETLENLKAAGASSLLVLPVEKMLA